MAGYGPGVGAFGQTANFGGTRDPLGYGAKNLGGSSLYEAMLATIDAVGSKILTMIASNEGGSYITVDGSNRLTSWLPQYNIAGGTYPLADWSNATEANKPIYIEGSKVMSHDGVNDSCLDANQLHECLNGTFKDTGEYTVWAAHAGSDRATGEYTTRIAAASEFIWLYSHTNKKYRITEKRGGGTLNQAYAEKLTDHPFGLVAITSVKNGDVKLYTEGSFETVLTATNNDFSGNFTDLPFGTVLPPDVDLSAYGIANKAMSLAELVSIETAVQAWKAG